MSLGMCRLSAAARDHDIVLHAPDRHLPRAEGREHAYARLPKVAVALLASPFSSIRQKSSFVFVADHRSALSLGIRSGMLLRLQWPCRRVHRNAKSLVSITARSFASSAPYCNDLATSKTRNIGIIAHIDAVCLNTYFFKM